MPGNEAEKTFPTIHLKGLKKDEALTVLNSQRKTGGLTWFKGANGTEEAWSPAFLTAKALGSISKKIEEIGGIVTIDVPTTIERPHQEQLQEVNSIKLGELEFRELEQLFKKQAAHKPTERTVITKLVQERPQARDRELVLEPAVFEGFGEKSKKQQGDFITLLSLCAYDADEIRFEPVDSQAETSEQKPAVPSGLLLSSAALRDLWNSKVLKDERLLLFSESYTFTELMQLMQSSIENPDVEEIQIVQDLDEAFHKEVGNWDDREPIKYTLQREDLENLRTLTGQEREKMAEMLAFAASNLHTRLYIKSKANLPFKLDRQPTILS